LRRGWRVRIRQGSPSRTSFEPGWANILQVNPSPAYHDGIKFAAARFRGRTSWIALASYLVLSLLLFASAWRDAFNVQVGAGTDGLLAMWFLKWLPFAISHGHNPLVTDYVDSQVGVNLMWNGSMPLVDLVFAPVTSTLGPVFSYNLVATLAVALSAWSAFLLISRYVERRVAAGVGGLLYGFSPYMMAHLLGHPALFIVFIPPLIFLLLDDALVRQRRGPISTGILLGLLAAAQLLIGQEILLLTALVGALVIVLLVSLDPGTVRGRAPHAARAFGTAAVVFLVVCAVPLGVQFFGPQRLHGVVNGPDTFVSDVLGFALPSSLQAIAPSWAVAISDRFTGGLAEATNAYLGVGLLLLLGYATWRFWSRPVIRVAALIGVFLAILSLGQAIHIAGRVTHIPVFVVALAFPLLQRWIPARLMLYGVTLLWLGIIKLPILDNILPVRLMLFVFLAAAVVLALLVDAILRAPAPTQPQPGPSPASGGGKAPRGGGNLWRLGGGLAVVAALALLIPSWPYPATVPPLPEFFRNGMVSQIPDGSVALVAPFAASTLNGLTPMYWQAAADFRFKMPEGYIDVPGGAGAYQPGGTSPSPPPSATQDVMRGVADGHDLTGFTETVQHEMLGELESWKVQTIIVGPMPHQDRMIEVFRTLLGRDPSYQGGVYVWWQVPS
jgi:hypothetical protein